MILLIILPLYFLIAFLCYLGLIHIQAYAVAMKSSNNPLGIWTVSGIYYGEPILPSLFWPVYLPTMFAARKGTHRAERATRNKIAEIENLKLLREASKDDPTTIAAIDSFATQRGLELDAPKKDLELCPTHHPQGKLPRSIEEYDPFLSDWV